MLVPSIHELILILVISASSRFRLHTNPSWPSSRALRVPRASAGSRQEEQQHEPGSSGHHQDRIPEHERYVHNIHETPRSVHGKVCQAGDCTCAQQSHCFHSLAMHQGMMPLPPLAPLIPLVDFNLRVSGVDTST